MVQKIQSRKLIWWITTILFSSFFIFYAYSFGSVVIAGEALVLLFVKTISARGKVNLCWTKLHSYLLAFALFCLASSLWAGYRSNAITMGITILEIFVCIAILLVHYYHFDSTDSILKSIMWGAIIVEIYTCFSFGLRNVIQYAVDGIRLPSTFLNSNTVGMLAAFSAIIIFYYFVNDGFRIWNLFIVLSITMVAVSMSRKAFVFLVVGISLMLLLVTKDVVNQRGGFVKMLLIVVLIISVAYYASSVSMFGSVFTRMEGVLSFLRGGEGDKSTMVRNQIIRTGMEYFRSHPLLGIGMDNARFTNVERIYLHNNYAELLTDGGVVGLLVYYSIYIYSGAILFKYRKNRDREYSIVFVILVLSLMMDFGMVSYYSKETYFYVLLIFLYTEKLKNKSISCTGTVDREY